MASLATDGMWGARTISALQAFLQARGHNGLQADGCFGMKTTSALQTYLQQQGFDVGKVDGMWGWRSIKATQSWTSTHGFGPKWKDGVWGDKSTRALQKLLNAPPSQLSVASEANPVAVGHPVSTPAPAPHATTTQDPTTAQALAPAQGLNVGQGPKPTIAFIGGTGRMGVHLCAAWAHAGYDVTMCSRTKEKAQTIVDALLSGGGYTEKPQGALASQGSISVPPCPADGWKLRAGTNADAADAELIVLGTMYEQAWSLLEAIAPQVRGRGKTILDMTNPFLKRPDGYGAGLPKDGPQAGILIHKGKLGDPSTKWVGAYKSVLWTLILPTGPKNPVRRPRFLAALRTASLAPHLSRRTSHRTSPRSRARHAPPGTPGLAHQSPRVANLTRGLNSRGAEAPGDRDLW